jgi:hypothetical protein
LKKIFVPTSSGADWQSLLAKPALHWKSGYSAMSTAACWEANSPNLPPEIQTTLDSASDPALVDLELLAAIPEWQVELPGGSTVSQTDVLAITRNARGLVIIGVEAKVDEPFGPTLTDKREVASPSQVERFRFLESELGSSMPLDGGIRYQLLHRTVSALLTARAFHAPVAVMLVQSFSPSSKWRDDFDAFSAALDAQPITPDLFELKLVGNTRLLVGWCHGDSKFLSATLP